MDPTVELLDRQVGFLLKQPDDASFLIQVGPFLQALSTDNRLASYLDDLRDELVSVIQVLEVIDAELVAELVELRHEFVGQVKDADDSAAVRPVVGIGAPDPLALFEYQQTLAYFDERAAAEPEEFNYKGEGGKARTLLTVLQAKDRHLLEREEAARQRETVESGTEEKEARSAEDDPSPERAVTAARVEPERTERDKWRTRVGNVDGRLDHALRWFRLRMRTSAGIALLKLEAARDAMQPPFESVDPDQGRTLQMMSAMLKLVGSSDYSLLKVADESSLSKADVQAIAARVADLRSSTERLHEELRHRIGLTRSRLALVHRFKLRSEWHDRDRMATLADDDDLAGGPEDRLTAELARYLFDQGLSPLSKPMTGGLQPDLLDPNARFYVEAKQYASSARGDIVKAVAQVMDTVGRLRGGQYEVDEAFCVVFRRQGPYYDLPATLRTQSYRLHLVLVDLAPTDEAGRRQKEKPSLIAEAEFFAAEAKLTDGAEETSGADTAPASDTVHEPVELPGGTKPVTSDGGSSSRDRGGPPEAAGDT